METASLHGSPPSRSAVPESARSRPSRTRIAVDLPEPLGPKKPWTSPRLTSRSRPSKAAVFPNVFRSPLMKTGDDWSLLPMALDLTGGIVAERKNLKPNLNSPNAIQIHLTTIQTIRY